jgi:hypothetical protein
MYSAPSGCGVLYRTHSVGGNDCLSCIRVEDTMRMFDTKQPAKNDGDLSELRALTRLAPPLRRDHASDAQLLPA